jgi:hypothetical protein
MLAMTSMIAMIALTAQERRPPSGFGLSRTHYEKAVGLDLSRLRASTAPVFSHGNPFPDMASKVSAELQRPPPASLSGEGSGEGCRGEEYPVLGISRVIL